MKKIISLTYLFFSFYSQAQNLSGIVVDENGGFISDATVLVIQTGQETKTNFFGEFYINVTEYPVTLEVSHIGYEITRVQVKRHKNLHIILKEINFFLDDVVVSASRDKEKLKESPVSIEVMSIGDFKEEAAPTFYSNLANLKGVDVNVNSLTFNSVNTRGFATFINKRFLQLVDGIDNSSPVLVFPIGNLAGANELDVQRVEILPGAASALYGSNAFNGVLSILTKNPFDYKGLSMYVKYGQTKQEAAGVNPYTDAGIRFATSNDYFGAKLNFSFLKGTDWLANDKTDIDASGQNIALLGSRETNPSYDGMNIYGDEIATLLKVSNYTGGALPNIYVSRTGYEEKYLTNNEAKSMKADVALHYRPKGEANSLELIWNSRFNLGNTLYQGTNHFIFKNIFIHQHKLEVKSKNFFIRGYYTGEDGGDSYDSRIAAWNINRKWRSDKDWFTDYTKIYIAARTGALPGGVQTEAQAHATARDFADNSPVDADGNPKTPRFVPGTEEFNNAFNEVVNDPDFKTGAKFKENSSIANVEGNYNFKNLIKAAEIQIGGSARRYMLRSAGTIFTDYDGTPINIDEFAGYMQISKKVFDDRLKFAASVRYDQQLGFEGNISPRFSAVYSGGQRKNHNFRISYQTGFRNPSTQNLYLGLNLGPITLIGAAEDNQERYKETLENGHIITGQDAYHNAYTLTSFSKFGQTHDPNDLVIANIAPIKPEKVTTYEFGYRGQINSNVGIDLATYYNQYKDFNASTKVMAIASSVGNVNDATAMNAISNQSYKPFLVYSNSDVPVTSYGADIGLSFKIKNTLFAINYDYAKHEFDENKDKGFKAEFNTPEHRVKLSIGSPKLFKNFGYKIDYRYQTEFLWQSSFADGIVPERNIIDAQFSYNIKKYETKIKIGGTNLLGKEYIPAPGVGKVGSIYYVSLSYGK